MKDIRILYEDERILAVYKPYGVAVQGGEKVAHPLIDTIGTLTGRKHYLIHRLDKDTSGILLVAKSSESAAVFSRLIANPQTVKQYYSICFGKPEPRRGYIHDDITRKGAVKCAGTAYETIASTDEFSFLSLRIDTGRMHQIRIHLAGRNTPVVADDKYGNFAMNRDVRTRLKARRLMLAAVRMIVPAGKAGGQTLDISVPVPEHMRSFMESAGFEPDVLPETFE